MGTGRKLGTVTCVATRGGWRAGAGNGPTPGQTHTAAGFPLLESNSLFSVVAMQLHCYTAPGCRRTRALGALQLRTCVVLGCVLRIAVGATRVPPGTWQQAAGRQGPGQAGTDIQGA